MHIDWLIDFFYLPMIIDIDFLIHCFTQLGIFHFPKNTPENSLSASSSGGISEKYNNGTTSDI